MMASVFKNESDREDGEIIEDEFEDISDNSLILTTGKCISPKEHLPEISLSSVSEAEELEKFKQRCRRGRRVHRKRKYSYRKTICIDSDSDEYVELDRKLLRAAIHIDNPDCLGNSLHTRLKAMANVGNDLNKEQKDESKKQLESQNVSSDEGDDDLIQLRLEALRTAVLNKFKHRKKTKIKEISESDGFEDIFCDTSEKLNDKENEIAVNNQASMGQIETKSSEISPEKQVHDIDNQSPQEEDEDVLRALLLASLSKKISEGSNLVSLQIQPPVTNTKLYSHPKTDQQNKKSCINKNPYKKTATNKRNLHHSKVQPIIININCDSDSEDESLNNSKLPAEISNIAIENSVEKFLKEQRAKVEENDKNKSFQSNIFNKSSLKLLPKIKQIEYHNLLKKLSEAQKLKQKEKLKGNNFNGHQFNSNSVAVQNGEHCKKKTYNTNKLVRNTFSVKSDVILHSQHLEQIPDLKNEVRILHKVLKEIQTQKSERLQMQSKYTTLTPIVKKINEASTERKKYDKEVERLLRELTEAKQKLHDSHINIANCVKELVTKKDEIDKNSIQNLELCTRVHFSSTPLKDQHSSDLKQATRHAVSAEIEGDNSGNIVKNSYIKDNYSEKCKTHITSDLKTLQSQQKGVVPKYTSPLDNMERLDLDDPFLIMCPYDIDGNCRDPDCVFKHYRN